MLPRRLGLIVGVGSLVAGCAAPAHKAALENFQVVSRGQDRGGDFCRDFHLTPVQAAWFFSRAEVLTAVQSHDRFNELPCWVRGTAQGRGGEWQWEVRAGGTARLVAPHGEVQLLGCNECDAVLSGNEEPPPP